MRRVIFSGLLTMMLVATWSATAQTDQQRELIAAQAAEVPAADGMLSDIVPDEGMEEPVATQDPAQGDGAEEPVPPALQIMDAVDVTLADFLWIARPLVVFADSPNNPSFQQQMRYIQEVADELLERDVVVIVDTDPAARSDPRLQLRPRGFSLVLLEKDGAVVQRKPSPWTGREIVHAIDRLPLRRQEMLERRPAGR